MPHADVGTPNLLWQGFYTSWITDVDSGSADSLHAFFLYGKVTLLGKRVPHIWKDVTRLWEADAVGDFEFRSAGGPAAFELSLPHSPARFQVGATYHFHFPFADAPDEIAVNDGIFWRRRSAADTVATFFWKADGPVARVTFILRRKGGVVRLLRVRDGSPSIRKAVGKPCRRLAPFSRQDLPATPHKPLFRQWLRKDTKLRPWPAPLPHTPWKTDDVGIIVDANGIGEHSFAKQAGNVVRFFRCRRLGTAGIDGIFYWPTVGWPPQCLGVWPTVPVEGELSLAEMDRFIKENGIRHIIIDFCQYGEWTTGNPLDWPDASRNYYARKKYFDAEARARIILARYPDVHVYFWELENRVATALCDPRNRIEAPTPDEAARAWDADGNLVTYDLWEKWRRILAANAEWNRKTRSLFPGNEHRVHFSCQVSSPFSAVIGPRGGSDVVDTKSIHRQNVQCFVAAGKGAKRHTGVRLQLEIDSYHSNSYNTLGPLEIEQIYRVFFASGADLIYAQADLFGFDRKHRLLPNDVGIGALRAIRWIRNHPRRGRQFVPFSFLQGDAVHLCHAPDSIQTRDGQLQRFPARADEVDFESVRCVLPHFGTWWRCHYDHMFSGAPYGPFEIAPAEAVLGKPIEARVSVMISWHGMTPDQVQQIGIATRAGKSFVAAIGHLKQQGRGDWVREGRPYAPGALDTFGVRLDRTGKMKVAGARVVATDQLGNPLITACGGAMLVWREWLQMLDAPMENETVLREIENLISRHRAVEFDPPNPYLEAVLHYRDDLLFLHVFHHGGIRQPSGLGKIHPAWRGAISIDAGEIANPRVVQSLDHQMQLGSPTKLEFQGRFVRFEAVVTTHAEWILSAKPLKVPV